MDGGGSDSDMNDLPDCIAKKGRACEYFTFKDNPRFFCVHLKAVYASDRDAIPEIKCTHPEIIVERVIKDLT